MILRKKVLSRYFDILTYLDNQNIASQPLLVDNMQHRQYVMAPARVNSERILLNTKPMKDQIRWGINSCLNRFKPAYESKCAGASQSVPFR